MRIQRAVKEQLNLLMAISGPSGSGKTFTALTFAEELRGDGRVLVVDTENGSSRLYADRFDFDIIDLEPPYHPDRFVEAVALARSNGYSVLVIDSLSHSWNGEGGALELVDKETARMKSGNSYMAWGAVTPIYRRMNDAIRGARGAMHVIATMRAKTAYVQEQQQRGGRTITVPRKIGMAPEVRDGVEYEYDVFLEMDIDNTAVVAKTRCPAITGQVFERPGAEVTDILKDWLRSGAAPKTEADYEEDMLNATDAATWARSAYQLPLVRNAFESAQRVRDWRSSLGDQPVERKKNVLLWPVLRTYANSIADGMSIKDSWAGAKQSWDAVTTPAPPPPELKRRAPEPASEPDPAKAELDRWVDETFPAEEPQPVDAEAEQAWVERSTRAEAEAGRTSRIGKDPADLLAQTGTDIDGDLFKETEEII